MQGEEREKNGPAQLLNEACRRCERYLSDNVLGGLTASCLPACLQHQFYSTWPPHFSKREKKVVINNWNVQIDKDSFDMGI